MPSADPFPYLPRALVDPIDGAARALAVLQSACRFPVRDQVVALTLDAHQCGVGVLVCNGVRSPDAVMGVTETVVNARRHHPEIRGLVLASTRRVPAGPPGCLVQPGDVDRWLELSDMAESAGLELLEWFVIGDDAVRCPRDLLGEPPRW